MTDPALGQHTVQVLTESGLSQERIRELVEIGAVAGLDHKKTSDR
jgi:crotonobetainyl-CoA:carnitine CoA-transferase CaiB-like acyl-CoA transferase